MHLGDVGGLPSVDKIRGTEHETQRPRVFQGHPRLVVQPRMGDADPLPLPRSGLPRLLSQEKGQKGEEHEGGTGERTSCSR